MSTYTKMTKISLGACGSQIHQTQKVNLCGIYVDLRLCCLELPAHHSFLIQLFNYHLSHYTSAIAQDMLNSLYVNNIISGCDTEDSVTTQMLRHNEGC